jgi:four helix bundle protein
VAGKILSHLDLEVYKLAFETSMAIFEMSKRFPREEVFSLTNQIRRSSRSVCANLAEAWRKRRYEAHFVSKLSDSEAEAAETQTWLEYVVRCGYSPRLEVAPLYKAYNAILRTLVGMINHTEAWILPGKLRARSAALDPD